MPKTRIKVKLDDTRPRCPLNRMDYTEDWQCALTETLCCELSIKEARSVPDDCPLRQGPVIVEAEDG